MTRQIEMASCPKCAGAGGFCGFCGQALCDERDVAQHPADADWSLCTLCGGEGELPALVADVWNRGHRSVAAMPQLEAVEDSDIQY